MWKHQTRKTVFYLRADDFGVKYHSKEDSNRLYLSGSCRSKGLSISSCKKKFFPDKKKMCQQNKKPGNYCMMDNWCRSGRCKGSSCSINLDNKWYTPLEGNCSFATDDCEPDTYCDTSGNPGDWLKGKGGECKFGLRKPSPRYEPPICRHGNSNR